MDRRHDTALIIVALVATSAFLWLTYALVRTLLMCCRMPFVSD